MPIIVSQEGKNAQRLEEAGVADEDYLQRFVSANPMSLPLEDIKENVRLMVVGREFSTASGPIDILAVDDDAEIYIIETKLFKNPDKRLVIAQVLDYGAALWRGYPDPALFVGDLDAFMTRGSGSALSAALREFFDLDDEGVEVFIDNLKRRLQEGGYRFVVLMDKLHARLKDLIMFMNQKTAFDIDAVEMEFYRHEGLEIVIPKVFGAEARKSISESGRKMKRWDEDTFLAELTSRQGEDAARIAGEIIHWVETKVSRIQWGAGYKDGSLAPLVHVNGQPIRIFYVWTLGHFNVATRQFIERTCFGDAVMLQELQSRLDRIPGMNPGDSEMQQGIYERPLRLLAEPDAMATFKETFDWVIEKVTAASE